MNNQVAIKFLENIVAEGLWPALSSELNRKEIVFMFVMMHLN